MHTVGDVSEALLHSLLHWPTYIQPEDTVEEVSHRDHMLYDSIYRKCSEQANPPWLESRLEVSRGWEKGRLRKGYPQRFFIYWGKRVVTKMFWN